GLFLASIYSSAAVPDEMLEAGRLDGVGELGLFHRLALPQLTPAIVTVVLFQFVAIWNNYMLPLVMLADEKLYPITLGLDNWRAQTDRLPEFYQLTTGGALLSVIPLAILILVLQRLWRGGRAEGSVEGWAGPARRVRRVRRVQPRPPASPARWPGPSASPVRRAGLVWSGTGVTATTTPYMAYMSRWRPYPTKALPALSRFRRHGRRRR